MRQKTSTGRDREGQPSVRYGHPAMRRSERAKIFMPFDALTGFRDLLERKEAEVADLQARGLIGPDWD